jgi:hypothetical protein
MTDPREEFSPFWPQTVAPFGATPQPPGSPPRLAWEFPRINQALLALWDSSKIPIPPAPAPWFPPATPPTAPASAAAHLDAANDWGAMLEPSDGQGRPRGESRGLLYSFSQPHQSLPDSEPTGGSRGILGSLSLPNNPWRGQPPYDAPGATRRADIPVTSLSPADLVPANRATNDATLAALRMLVPHIANPDFWKPPGPPSLMPTAEGKLPPADYDPRYAGVVGDVTNLAMDFFPVAGPAKPLAELGAKAISSALQSATRTALPAGKFVRAVRPRAMDKAAGVESPHSGATGDAPITATPRPDLSHSARSDALPIRSAEPEITPSYLEPGSVRTPPGGRGQVFDDSRLHEVPPVEQFNLPRYQPLRGVPGYIQALDNPQTLKDIDRLVEIGLVRDGHKATNLEPLRELFLAQLGAEKGQATFKQFTDLMGAVSSVSTDLATLRNASYFDALIKQKETLPTPSWDSSRRRYILPDPLPYPYGHFKQGLHAKKAIEVDTQKGLDPLTDPKLASLAEQFRGNQMPIPIDRHVVRALGATDARGLPLDILPRSANEFVERLLQRRAWDMGLTPGQYQGALRAGAAEYTRLRSPEPILTTLQKRLAITAHRNNIPMAEVLRRLIANGYKLRSLGTIAGLGAAASGREDKTPEEQE